MEAMRPVGGWRTTGRVGDGAHAVWRTTERRRDVEPGFSGLRKP